MADPSTDMIESIDKSGNKKKPENSQWSRNKTWIKRNRREIEKLNLLFLSSFVR
jgi:hypothetical protein